METKLVKCVRFNLYYKGDWYRDLELNYTREDDVDKEYLYSEDGPWYMLEVGKDILDFQFFSFDGETLKLDICVMRELEGIFHRGDILSHEDGEYDYENVRVEYYD